MILIGIGANLPSERFGSAIETCSHALGLINAHPNTKVLDNSRWFESAPVPPSDQPWFINGVASLKTDLSATGLLDVLHEIESQCGRERREGVGEKNAPRVLDLDLLDFNGELSINGQKKPILPHPRMDTRAFVLLPMADVAPDWRHPRTKQTLDELIKALNPDQVARAVEGT
ncbi:MAG: 2-amino-4-hydroxy-6-hydroxymethyldihydropteridine diphosphokinase [Rhodospirillaceae bacterium]|nr:2-amino-4-hydroxy-6-hydroxymethyldihydropteridine diphosphokinase [Rhodospirillaceae bacterium]